MTLPAEVADAVAVYLRCADRLLPGAVVACGVAGSVALGAYRESRSDIDLLVVLHDEQRRRALLPRLRALHLSQVPRLAGRLAAGRGLSATCNSSFVWASQLGLPVEEIDPVASHVGEIFATGAAFDVNPVVWRELLTGGVAVRGPAVAEWGLRMPSGRVLRAWNRRNLETYWAAQLSRLERRSGRVPSQTVEWCVLGPARLHATIRTGAVLSKEAAGEHIAHRFPVHRRIVELAQARLRGAALPSLPPRSGWRGATADLMREVMADALAAP